MPRIAEEVEKFFGKKASKGVNLMRLLLLTAIQGGVLSGDVKMYCYLTLHLYL
jgi:molecular chaperone DnaK